MQAESKGDLQMLIRIHCDCLSSSKDKQQVQMALNAGRSVVGVV